MELVRMFLGETTKVIKNISNRNEFMGRTTFVESFTRPTTVAKDEINVVIPTDSLETAKR